MKILYSMGIDTDGMRARHQLLLGQECVYFDNVKFFLFGLLFNMQDSQIYENVYRGSDSLEEFVYTRPLQ